MAKSQKIKDNEFKTMKKVPNKRDKYVDKSFHFYFSYTLRVVAMFVSILIIGYFAYVCFNESFSEATEESLKFSEKGDASYEVKLLEENLFVTGVLNPDGSYMSDVIDVFSTNFNYEDKLENNINAQYSYNVVATMILKNSKDGSVISKKEDTLVEESKTEEDVNSIKINQNVNLDYAYYNNLANDVKAKYNDVDGTLNLKMTINKNIDYDKFDSKIDSEEYIEVNIPLLSTQVKAEVVHSIDNNSEYFQKNSPKLINKISLYSGVALLIMDTIFLLLAIGFIFRARGTKSKYCTLRDGLLRDYDNIIVNSKSIPKISKFNIIDCYSFSELMDAQRLLGKPIIYYEIVKNQKCMFVIFGDTDVYKFTLKECDIDY